MKEEKLPEIGKRYFVPGGKGELTLVVTYVNQREDEPTTVFMACENPADRTDRLGTPYRLDYFWRTQRKYSKPSLEN